MRFKKILFCTDFSPPSREAFATAVTMAADSGAELVLVHVLELYSYASDLPMPLAREEALTADAMGELDALARQAREHGVKVVSARTLTGAPWHHVVQLLENDPTFDLAIMGTHGRTGIKRVLLGSVAEKVVRHAPCAVLVVRSRAAH